MQFKTIKTDEYEKYQTILSKHGFNTDHFSLMEEPAKTKTLPDETVPKGGITIICRSNNRKKTYPSATGSLWTETFEEDLVRGFFNS